MPRTSSARSGRGSAKERRLSLGAEEADDEAASLYICTRRRMLQLLFVSSVLESTKRTFANVGNGNTFYSLRPVKDLFENASAYTYHLWTSRGSKPDLRAMLRRVLRHTNG